MQCILTTLSTSVIIKRMAKRITIMIDDDLDRKLRLLQAREIQSTTSSVSYSQIINQTLQKKLK